MRRKMVGRATARGQTVADARTDVAADALEIDVILDDSAWDEAVPDAVTVCRRAIEAAARAVGLPAPSAGVAILLTGDDHMRALNAEFRGKDAPTNVLSFPASEDIQPEGSVSIHLGDIAIARETVAREAAEAGKTAADHLAHMAIHGFLHLLGYDHRGDDDAREMEALERRILAGLDIADPY